MVEKNNMKILVSLLIFLFAPQMIWANNQLWQYSKSDSTKIVALLDEAKNEKEDTNFPLYFANKLDQFVLTNELDFLEVAG